MSTSLPGSPEWLAFASGVKPAVRVASEAAPAEVLAAAARERGYAARVSAAPSPGSDKRWVYVAKTVEHADRACAAEASVLPGARMSTPGAATLESHRRLGELLGYPGCCVDAYIARLGRDVTIAPDGGRAHEDFVAVHDILARSERCCARLNHLLPRGVTPLISHYPCRYDCAASLVYADAVFELVRNASPDRAAQFRRLLETAVAVCRDGARVAAEGAPADAVVVRFSEW
jgi:hypothetical protein